MRTFLSAALLFSLAWAMPNAPVSYHGLGLVSGILETLGNQAGVVVHVPVAPATLKLVRADVEGPFKEVFASFVKEHLPGWALEEVGNEIRLLPPEKKRSAKPPATPRHPASSPKPAEYVLVGNDGTRLPAPFPNFRPVAVVDSVVKTNGSELELELSPLGPTCLYFPKGAPVCLRPTAPGVEGTTVLETPIGPLTVRYRTRAQSLVLYRVRVNPTPTRPVPTHAPAAAPSKAGPPAPSKPKKEASPKPLASLGAKVWQLDPAGPFVYRGLRLKPAPEGTYYQLAAFRNPANAAAFARGKSRVLPGLIGLFQKGKLIAVVAGPEDPDRNVARRLREAQLRFLTLR